MGSLIGKRPACVEGLTVEVVREKSDLPSMSGTITWISNSEFMMVLLAPLKFKEKIEIVLSFGGQSEIRFPASVDIIKRDAGSRLLVHGSFENPIENELLDRLSSQGAVDRRKKQRYDCELTATIQRENCEEKISAEVCNVSEIGCKLLANSRLNINEHVVIKFLDWDGHQLCVSAVVSRQKQNDDKFEIGCSFQKNSSHSDQERDSRSNWFDKVSSKIFSRLGSASHEQDQPDV